MEFGTILENHLNDIIGATEGAEALVTQLRALVKGDVAYETDRAVGRILRRLETADRWKEHPGQFSSFNMLMKYCGLSKSQASDFLTWERIIWPYLTNELNMDPRKVYASLGRTKLRRLTPVLRSLIEDKPLSGKARYIVEQAIKTAESLSTVGQAIKTEESASGVETRLASKGERQRLRLEKLRRDSSVHPKNEVISVIASGLTPLSIPDLERGCEPVMGNVTTQQVHVNGNSTSVFTISFQATDRQWKQVQAALRHVMKINIQTLPTVN
jgi:hypothetical protein